MLIARKKKLLLVATWLSFFIKKTVIAKNLWLIIFSPQDANMLGVFVPMARK
jgi:hypothetical protein